MAERCTRCGSDAGELIARKAVIHIILDGSEVGAKEASARLCKNCQGLRAMRGLDLPKNHYRLRVIPSELRFVFEDSGHDVTITILPLVRQLIGFC